MKYEVTSTLLVCATMSKEYSFTSIKMSVGATWRIFEPSTIIGESSLSAAEPWSYASEVGLVDRMLSLLWRNSVRA